jgi:hypothetical protein
MYVLDSGCGVLRLTSLGKACLLWGFFLFFPNVMILGTFRPLFASLMVFFVGKKLIPLISR